MPDRAVHKRAFPNFIWTSHLHRSRGSLCERRRIGGARMMRDLLMSFLGLFAVSSSIGVALRLPATSLSSATSVVLLATSSLSPTAVASSHSLWIPCRWGVSPSAATRVAFSTTTSSSPTSVTSSHSLWIPCRGKSLGVKWIA